VRWGKQEGPGHRSDLLLLRNTIRAARDVIEGGRGDGHDNDDQLNDAHLDKLDCTTQSHDP